MKAKSRGFTLIELMVVIALLGVLASLVAPSFKGALARRAVLAAASDVASDLRLARSEAAKRSSFVTVCRSTDTATCAAKGSWHTGWIMFLDRNGDGVKDAADEVLRVHQELAGIQSLGASTLADTKETLTFRPNGLGIGINDSWVATPSASTAAGSTRLLCISSQGRLSVGEEGASAC
jgi:type IV fimbrial biogenesis protein FimT